MRTALRAVAASLLFLSSSTVLAQVSLNTLNTAVTQDFNSLAISGTANVWAK